MRRRPEWASRYSSWVRHRNASSEQCNAFGADHDASLADLKPPPTASPAAVYAASLEGIGISPTSNPLGTVLREYQAIASARMRRGTPAFEREPSRALRYRQWRSADVGTQTRHGRGDSYPLYTIDTLRNLAAHLFDHPFREITATEACMGRLCAEKPYARWPRAKVEALAARVKPCDLIYTTFEPGTSYFLQWIDANVPGPYLLLSDTSDSSIVRGSDVDALLTSPKLFRWWAANNEVEWPVYDLG